MLWMVFFLMPAISAKRYKISLAKLIKGVTLISNLSGKFIHKPSICHRWHYNMSPLALSQGLFNYFD